MSEKRPSSPTAALALANRLRGAAVLSVLALIGYGLQALGGAGLPATQAVTLRKGQDDITLLMERLSLPLLIGNPEFRLLLSRLPLEVDAARSLIRLEGGPERILPPGWPAALVDRRGRIARGGIEIDLERAQDLLSGIRKGSFEGAKKALIAWDPRLEKFFEDVGGQPPPAPGPLR